VGTACFSEGALRLGSALLPDARAWRVAPSIFRSGRGHMSRLVRKNVGVAERQEAFPSGTSRRLPRKAGGWPREFSGVDCPRRKAFSENCPRGGATRGLREIGWRADRMGVRDSSCCPATPAILRIGRTTWYDLFRKIDGATRRPVARGVPGAERVYEIHEEMSRVWRN